MKTKENNLSIYLIGFIVLALIVFSFERGLLMVRQNLHHVNLQFCPVEICDVDFELRQQHVATSHSQLIGSSKANCDSVPTLQYPIADQCSYVCTSDANEFWQLFEKKNAYSDDAIWVYMAGDSVLRRIFLDLYELLTLENMDNYDKLVLDCQMYKFINNKTKCVLFDFWLARPRQKHEQEQEQSSNNTPLIYSLSKPDQATHSHLVRMTFAAKHNVIDTVEEQWQLFSFTKSSKLQKQLIVRPDLFVINSGLW